MIAKSVVCGDSTYFSRIILACTLMPRSRARPAASSAIASPSFQRNQQPVVILHRKLGIDRKPARRTVTARHAHRKLDALGSTAGGSRRCARIDPTSSTCSSNAASWTSPYVPRDLTLVNMRFRSPTPRPVPAFRPALCAPAPADRTPFETIRQAAPRELTAIFPRPSHASGRACARCPAARLVSCDCSVPRTSPRSS